MYVPITMEELMRKLPGRASVHLSTFSIVPLVTFLVAGCDRGPETHRDSATASASYSATAGNCTRNNPIPCSLPPSFPNLDSTRSAEFLLNDSWEDDAHSAHGKRSCGSGCTVTVVVAPETRTWNLNAAELASSGHFIGLVRNTDPNPAKIAREFGIGGGDTAYWLVRSMGSTAAHSEFWSHKTGTWRQVGETIGYGQCDKDGTKTRSYAAFDHKPCPLKTSATPLPERTPAVLTSWPPATPAPVRPPAFDVPPLWVTCKFGCCTVDIAS